MSDIIQTVQDQPEMNEEPVFFRIEEEAVFDTSLATLQLSPKI
jgi:hypothetical protein